MKKQKKSELVDLFNEFPVQFTNTDVHKELTRINNGGAVNVKKIVKMLYQLQYIMPEYESLRHSMHWMAKEMREQADFHFKITEHFEEDKKKIKEK